MRLHRLTLRAFGPFAGAEDIDFDELSDAGLFLLTGPTGAGKTTVLDAICFALYGSVPGVRGVKTLKSQHAPDDVRPEVVLDFSVRDRRFVVRRTPEWTRPKRRGEGVITEKASATLVETTGGPDHLLSSRAQEVGHFVSDLIGMQSTQFAQVAMLPQGDFQKFLRASSQDRHDVLQHLFRTNRYSQIEEWVHDHSRGLKERAVAQQQVVGRVLDTVADRADAALPEELSEAGLAAPGAPEHAVSWLDGLSVSAEVARAAAQDQHGAALAEATEARTCHERAGEVHAVHDRRIQARAVLDELARDADTVAETRRMLDADARAAQCLPLLRMLDDVMAQQPRLVVAWSACAAELETLATEGLSLPATAAGLADLEQRARSGIARLEALLPRERELHDARVAMAEAEVALAGVHTAHDAARARAGALPGLLADARARAAALAGVAGRSATLGLEVEQARRRLEAAQAASRCALSLPGLRDAQRDARDLAADARELVQDLAARRLAGIAAELAGTLVAGESCQVCGSVDHPAPATTAGDAVTEAEQAAASARYDTAAATLASATADVERAEERLDGLRAAAGQLGIPTASAHLEERTEELRNARRAATDLESAEADVLRLAKEQDQAARDGHDLALRAAALTQSVETHRRTIEVLRVELGEDADVAVPLAEQITTERARAESFGNARESLARKESAQGKLDELQQHAEESARALGFDDVDALRAATLEPNHRRRLEKVLEERTQAAARASSVLEETADRAQDDGPLPDLDALAERARSAEEQSVITARSLHQCEASLEALRRLRGRLQDALADWVPAREEFLRAESMAQLVRGMGSDNQLQMRLSAYVLATRLDQVLAAANERLAHMRDQRYLLQRTGRAARKGSQAGLGLEVVDQWTGDVRDPGTLSGGETFVVSLALALGLADVVTQEAGGTEIETLFVDEGFGTLDADTLDDVMDRLDDLRAGGRAVGVVSHVGELRNRIPTQLHVDKHRTGSTVSVRTLVG